MQKGLLFPILVVLFGVLLLLKNLFNWNISIFKVFFGLAVIVVGISLLTGGFRWFRDGFGYRSQDYSQAQQNSYQGSPAGRNEDVVFSQRSFTATQTSKFSYIFASGSVDLTQLPPGQHVITIDSVFAGVAVYVSPGASVEVRGSSAFGQVRLPNGDAAFFGSVSRGAPADIKLVCSSVFGSIEIFEKA